MLLSEFIGRLNRARDILREQGRLTVRGLERALLAQRARRAQIQPRLDVFLRRVEETGQKILAPVLDTLRQALADRAAS